MRSPLVALVLLTLVAAGCLGGSGNGGSQQKVVTQACEPPAAAPDASWKAEWPQVKINTTMGDVVARLDLEQAPITAGNFLNLTSKGYFDGLAFHRVIKGFVIQGGDPTSKTDPHNAGAGGPGYSIPDEFNPQLRHDAAGVLSMATAGPDTGGSQFFVTLSPTPNLDDRHSVFGRVVSGMDVVSAIGNVTTASNDAPVTPVWMNKVEAIASQAFEARHAVGIHPVIAEKKEEAGRAVTFAVILKNDGNVRDSIGLKATVPAGWSCSVDQRPVVPAGTARVVFLTLTPPSGATGNVEVPLSAQSAWNGTAESSASVKVDVAALGAQVKDGDKVTANYVGFLPDGRLFDTSVESVAKDPAMPKLNTSIGGFQVRPAYDTFSFTVGSGVIAGFTNLAKTAKEGEIVTARIPAKDAYATGNMYQRPLTGRDLVFELQVVKIG